MPKVECSDCGGSGQVIARKGGRTQCLSCGGAGFSQVEENEITDEMRDRIID